MMRRKLGLLLPVVALTLFLLSSAACAGIYWESEVVNKGMPGQPDGARIEKHFITPNAARVELGTGAVTITDYDAMILYQLDPSAKTYTEVKLDAMMPKGSEKMMESMAQGMQYTPTEEKKTIEGYACKKYNVSIMGMNGEYWVSKDVKGFGQMKEISRKVGNILEKNPMMRQMNIMGMIDKVDGFPVQSSIKMMGGERTATLKKVEEKDLSADLFKVPAGYTKTTRPGMPQ